MPLRDTCPNPHITLESTWSKIHHICSSSTCTPDSQIPNLSNLWLAFSNYRLSWDKCHMTPKLHWILPGQKYSMYVLLVTLSPKFHLVSLYSVCFSRYGLFWDMYTEWPKWYWTLQGERYPKYIYLCIFYFYSGVPNLTPDLLDGQLFSRYRPFFFAWLCHQCGLCRGAVVHWSSFSRLENTLSLKPSCKWTVDLARLKHFFITALITKLTTKSSYHQTFFFLSNFSTDFVFLFR